MGWTCFGSQRRSQPDHLDRPVPPVPDLPSGALEAAPGCGPPRRSSGPASRVRADRRPAQRPRLRVRRIERRHLRRPDRHAVLLRHRQSVGRDRPRPGRRGDARAPRRPAPRPPARPARAARPRPAAGCLSRTQNMQRGERLRGVEVVVQRRRERLVGTGRRPPRASGSSSVPAASSRAGRGTRPAAREPSRAAASASSLQSSFWR